MAVVLLDFHRQRLGSLVHLKSFAVLVSAPSQVSNFSMLIPDTQVNALLFLRIEKNHKILNINKYMINLISYISINLIFL